MRTLWVTCLMVLVCLTISVSATDRIAQDSITYPPKPPETTTKEMVAAAKGLIDETAGLIAAMANGVREDGGVIATLKKHKKFYGSIAIFGILSLLWLKNRRR